MVVYVEHMLLAGHDTSFVDEFKNFLEKHFKFKDLRPLKYFLGVEIARSDLGISVF